MKGFQEHFEGPKVISLDGMNHVRFIKALRSFFQGDLGWTVVDDPFPDEEHGQTYSCIWVAASKSTIEAAKQKHRDHNKQLAAIKRRWRQSTDEDIGRLDNELDQLEAAFFKEVHAIPKFAMFLADRRPPVDDLFLNKLRHLGFRGVLSGNELSITRLS